MILDDIVDRKKKQLEEEAEMISMAELEKRAILAAPVKDFAGALSKKGLSIIAEIKKASPSKGLISQDFTPVATANAYVEGGTDCISVLTEKFFFQGSDEIFEEVRNVVNCPMIRKDFIISERQVIEARAIGADAILLIASILDDKTLRRLYVMATELGMDCLMEAHTIEEAKRLMHAGGRIIGVNNRNLSTFHVDLHNFGTVRKIIPSSMITVAESGIHSTDDVKILINDGCDAILVGELLMRADNPAKKLAELRMA